MFEILTANLRRHGLTLEGLGGLLSREGFPGDPAFIHGSVLTQRFDPLSDIDLIVLTQKSPPGHLCVPCGTTRLDITVTTMPGLLLALHAEAAQGRDDIATALIDGESLSGHWDGLRTEALKLLTCSPAADLRLARNRCRDAYRHIARNQADSRLERMALATELTDAVGDLMLRTNGFWSTDSLALAQRLKTRLPNFFALFESAISHYVVQAKLVLLEEILVAQFGSTIDSFEPCRSP